jgi:hypothetical protein
MGGYKFDDIKEEARQKNKKKYLHVRFYFYFLLF